MAGHFLMGEVGPTPVWHTKESKPDFGLGFQAKNLRTFQPVPSSLASVPALLQCDAGPFGIGTHDPNSSRAGNCAHGESTLTS